MYKYVFSDEDKQKLAENAKKSQNMIDAFEQIDSKYDGVKTRKVSAGNLDLTKMTYTAPTDEDVKKQAENSLYEYKQESENAINSQYETKLSNVEKNINQNVEDIAQSKGELEKLYGSLKKNASNDALKRGLARSSIIVNKLEAFDKDMLKNYMELDEQFKTKLSNLNQEKELLQVQKDSALSNFNISYAIKLEDKITSLTQQIKEQEETVLKYNNQIAEKEAEYEREQEELNNKYQREDRQDMLDYLEYVEENGIVNIETQKAKEKYEVAYDNLIKMNKQEAIDELNNNPVYRKQLANFYEKLVSLMQKRND